MKTTWEQDGAVLTARVFGGLVSVRLWASEEHVMATAVYSGDDSLRIERRAGETSMFNDPMVGHAPTDAAERAILALGYALEPPSVVQLDSALEYALRRASTVAADEVARRAHGVWRDTCFRCGNLWGACMCVAYDDDPFEWGGVEITQPNIDATGRFFVEPELYYGSAYVEWRDRRAARGR